MRRARSAASRPDAASPRSALAGSDASRSRPPSRSAWPFIVTVRTSSRCSPASAAICRLEPFGEDNGKTTSRSAPDRRARWLVGEAVRRARLPRQGRPRLLVLEADRPPPAALVEQVRQGLRGLAPTTSPSSMRRRQSLAGTVQIVARCLEVALHKAHELDFPLRRHRRWHRRPRRSRRRRRTSSPRWAAPTTPSSMAAACSSS